MDRYLVRAIRLKQNLTQSQFADLLGVSESTIAAYENGRRSTSANVRVKIVDSIGEITPEMLELAAKARKADAIFNAM